MTMTKQDRICMISLFAVMLVLDREKLGNRDFK